MATMRPKTKLLLVLAGVIALAFVVEVVWSEGSLRLQMEEEMQERGRVIAMQMQATWDYLVATRTPQAALATPDSLAEGTKLDQGEQEGTTLHEINCAVAGRTLSLTFNDSSSYVTRYVSDKPRNEDDTADEFEQTAMAALRQDDSLKAYSGISEYEGRKVFRYVEPMVVTDLCIDCHGGPKGQRDETGHVKEGYALGDIMGAVSVVVPTDSFAAREQEALVRNVALAMFIMALVLVVVFYAMRLLRMENLYKSDFLSVVSHELRTPLTSIVAFSEVLAGKEGLTKEEETARREIESNSRVILSMVNDILEVNRLDAGRTQLAIEAVDMVDLLCFVEPAVSPLARKAGVTFSTMVDTGVPVIEADFDKLAHAIENLAFNAVKFTPAGGEVSIHVSSTSDVVRIAVADTGIGIDPADQMRIFERFEQVDGSAARHYNGTGLGLPLARDYVQLHGGVLTLQSVVGEGSTFTIELPLVQKKEK